MLSIVLMVTACGQISRERAITIAAENSDVVEPVLFNAYMGTIGNQADTWIVTFRGNQRFCDGPGVPGSPESLPCHLGFGEVVVHVDAKDGTLLGSSFKSIGP